MTPEEYERHYQKVNSRIKISCPECGVSVDTDYMVTEFKHLCVDGRTAIARNEESARKVAILAEYERQMS